MRENITKYLYHWPLYVISLVVLLTLAVFFLRSEKPTYEIQASILIQDATKTEDNKSALQELNLSKIPKLVENEVEVLKSREIIGQAVKELNLTTNYQLRRGLRWESLYSNAPFKLNMVERNNLVKESEIKILLTDTASFQLSDNGSQFARLVFGKIYNTPIGTWWLEKTDYLDNFIDTSIRVSISDEESLVNYYQNKLKIGMVDKQTPLIHLSIKESDRQRGIDLINQILKIYTAAEIAEKNLVTRNTIDFIDDRLVNIATELDSFEKEEEGFKVSRGLTDISAQSQVYLQNIQANDIQLNKVNVQLNIIEGIEKYMQSQGDSHNIPATLGIEDPGLNSAIERLARLLLDREKLLATTPESNPIFEPVDRQIQTTKAVIRENIKNIKSSLLATKSRLESFNSKFESSVRQIPIQERQFLDIKREKSIKENLYVYLLQKKEQLSLSYASTLSAAKIVDHAYSGAPKKTNTAFLLAAAVMLALTIPTGYILGRDTLARKITSSDEITEETEAPVLAELSFEKSPSLVVALDKGNFAIGEEFRSLRTNLSFLHEAKSTGRVTLLTSSISKEGKSFVSSNLAIVLAAANRKTVLIELDLRRPKISSAFNLPSGALGISDYLTRQCKIEDIIQKSDQHEKLHIISSGRPPSNPSELLEQRQKLEEMFDWLKANYDDVIVDTPPIRLVTDAKILSAFADVTLFIVRQAYTHKSLAPFIKSLYSSKHFKRMHIIFNSIKKGKYGYGYEYGSDYYAVKTSAR